MSHMSGAHRTHKAGACRRAYRARETAGMRELEGAGLSARACERLSARDDGGEGWWGRARGGAPRWASFAGQATLHTCHATNVTSQPHSIFANNEHRHAVLAAQKFTNMLHIA
jgi:hypothetical protein